MSNKLIFLVPTADDVANLRPGDEALACFGKFRKVTSIRFRGVDVHGAPYVGFDTEFGPNSTMSGSYKAGELVRTVALSNHYTNAQLNTIEREMVAAGERLREV